MKRGGWYGNPQGHAMAARGIKLYMKRRTTVDPLFYARKQEEMVPMHVVAQDVRAGVTLSELERRHPDADDEELRRRAIKAMDMVDGTNTMSLLDKNGVDESMRLAKHDVNLRGDMKEALSSDRKMSYLHPVKVAALRKRMEVEYGR